MSNQLTPDWVEPPKDSSVSGSPFTVIHGEGESQQLQLGLTWQIAPGVPAVRPVEPQSPSPKVTPSSAEHVVVLNDEGRPVSITHPSIWAHRMARMVFEVGCGERPATQLKGWVSRDQLSILALRGRSFARHPSSRAQKGMSRLRHVKAVRTMQVAPGIIEASAVIVGSTRAHAVALRMEARGEQWLLTAVSMQ